MSDPGTAPSGPETASEAVPGRREGQSTDDRYERLKAAMNAGYTGERAEWVAERLQGDTPEALASDAQAIGSLFDVKPARVMATDPSQARGNGSAPKTETLGDTLKRMANGRGRAGMARG